MRMLLVLAMALVSANSFALTTRLDFQVRSSGPDAFPCNAGIRHQQAPTTDRYGRQIPGCVGPNCLSGFETETGTIAGDITATNRNAVSAWGIHIPDIMKGHTGLYNPNSVNSNLEVGSITPFSFKGAWGTTWHTIVGEDRLSFLSDLSKDLTYHRLNDAGVRKNKVLTDLVFLFASEQYGTEYFVDVCNYFPETYCDASGDCKITSADMGNDPASTWSNLVAFLSGKKEGTLDYINLSTLKVDVVTYCDGQLFQQFAGYPNLVPGDFTSMSMGSLGTIPPQKCVTRFTFKETNTDKMRLNQLQNACFEVGTQVDESASAGF